MNTIITILTTLLASAVFAVVATVLRCLLSGLDRKISARMQGRVGPPILQPYYDVMKLLSKEDASPNAAIGTYIFWALIFVFVSGGIFFSGGNFLLCVFVIMMPTIIMRDRRGIRSKSKSMSSMLREPI